MKEGIAFAHEHGVKVYVTANILAHNGDLAGVREYFQELREIKPDALIISDPGVFMIAKEVCPEIERHVSTQQTIPTMQPISLVGIRCKTSGERQRIVPGRNPGNQGKDTGRYGN